MYKRVPVSVAVVQIGPCVLVRFGREWSVFMQINPCHIPAETARRTGPFSRAATFSWVALLSVILGLGPVASASTKDPYEILAAAGLDRDIKQGYALRTDTWSGDLPVDGSKRIEYTLFRPNDYHFYAYSSTKGAKISFHIQDRDGNLVETRSWQKQNDDFCFAGADVSPKATGTFYLAVRVDQTAAERTEWALVFAYK